VSLIFELLREVFALSPSTAILVSAQGNPDFHPVAGACPPAQTLDMWHVPVYRTEGQRPPHQSVTRRTVPDLPLPLPDIVTTAIILGKIWERTQNLKMPAKSHRIKGPLDESLSPSLFPFRSHFAAIPQH
jgi:hypothetical protein